MKLVVKRRWFSEISTVGELFVDNQLDCYVLEDTVRTDPIPSTPANEAKVYGKTAIPAGTYDVSITFSNRFGKRMPLLHNVPGFEGIRIHAGNVAANTHGCLLVGQTRGQDSIGYSKVAYDALFLKLDAAQAAHDPITISIVEERDVATHAIAGE